MSKNTNSQKETVLNALKNGKTLTTAQLTNSYKVTSASEVIRQLRSEGYAVYTNTDSNGKVSYRLGTPSRRMIAAAYNAAGSTLFTRN
jgi:imidazolonepropionase-like amidohydrolase